MRMVEPRPKLLKHKLMMLVARFVLRFTPTDMSRFCMSRPHLFGRPAAACAHRALRGPSKWSVGERELFATFVSHLNQCVF